MCHWIFWFGYIPIWDIAKPLQIMQQQNFKVASQPSRHDLSINLTSFSAGFDLGMISFARATFLYFFD
jgi:hypothetical protein